MSSRSEESSVPELPVESAGSSVSSSLQKEYEQLLRYAVVTPKVTVPKTQPKRTNFKEHEFTTTGTSSESYELDTRDLEKEVTVLPSTPPVARVNGQYSNKMKSKTEETSPQPKESDQSYSSSEASTPNGSMVSTSENSPVVDADLVRMESQLDAWCKDMKSNILAEFMQCKMALQGHHKQDLLMKQQRHATEMNKKQNELESLKELLYTYEKTMEHKDNIIANMTKAIQKQKDRFYLLRRFNTWKIKHVDEKKEAFGTNLAKKHHNHVIKGKIWSAWRSIVEMRWKQKVEKACQSKAQDVCLKLTNDYEAKLFEANKALDSARLEVNRLRAEREIYEETMKKAFMRGVCALNLEAMHMFRDPEDEDAPGESCDNQQRNPCALIGSGNEMIPRSQPPKSTTSAVTQAHAGNTSYAPHTNMANTGLTAGQQGRTINVKAVGRADFKRDLKTAIPGSGPPGANSVSSVLVQRHSGADAISSKTIRHPQLSQNTTAKTTRSKSGGTSTVRIDPTPPVKVVH